MRANSFMIAYVNGSRQSVNALIDPDRVTRAHLEQYLSEMAPGGNGQRDPIREIKYKVRVAARSRP